MTGAAAITVMQITEDAPPQQGASGSEVRVYSVIHKINGGQSETVPLVIKNASPLEQQVIQLLTNQRQAIPAAYIPELRADQSMSVYMQYARARPVDDTISDPYHPIARQVADSLARIHAANRMPCPAWLPKVSDNLMGELYLNETQIQWERCLQSNEFYSEFGQYDTRLRSSLDQFLALMHDLTTEADTLTLINSDLHPDHIRLLNDGRPVFIDWQQACYGSFYLDLVNYFSIETALLYRDALADAGYSIPPAEFMERFREVGRYMGLRYFEVGLLAWQAGGEHWQQGRWFFHYCLTMALSGR
jgi:aminoglycoside phosphotransferase (APT) family kinase protein